MKVIQGKKLLLSLGLRPSARGYFGAQLMGPGCWYLLGKGSAGWLPIGLRLKIMIHIPYGVHTRVVYTFTGADLIFHIHICIPCGTDLMSHTVCLAWSDTILCFLAGF